MDFNLLVFNLGIYFVQLICHLIFILYDISDFCSLGFNCFLASLETFLILFQLALYCFFYQIYLLYFFPLILIHLSFLFYFCQLAVNLIDQFSFYLDAFLFLSYLLLQIFQPLSQNSLFWFFLFDIFEAKQFCWMNKQGISRNMY